MANKIILEFTEQQLSSFVSIIQTCEANLGCSEGDKEMIKDLKSMIIMLKRNGYKSPINLT